MPRRFRRKRRTRRTRRGGMSTRKAAFLALSHVDLENKFVDYNSGAAATEVNIDTPLVISINGVVGGDSATSRVGKTAKFTSVLIRTLTTANANAAGILGFMLVLDKQPDGGVVLNELLADSTVDPQLSANNLNNSRRFNMLARWTQSVVPVITPLKIMTKYKKLHFSTRYDSVGGGVGDITTNALFLVVFSSSPSGGQVAPGLNWHVRIRFVG